MRRTFLLALVLFASGCATYTARMQTARDLYFEEKFDASISNLSALMKKASRRDLGLLLLERGKANLVAGRLDSAIADFNRAEHRFLEIENTVSLAESFASILINPTQGEYQAESHEKILINAYLCLAYWLKGDLAGAFVERNRTIARLVQYLGTFPEEDRSDFDVPFARYLAAVLYEVEGKVEDARIEYEAIARTNPDFEPPTINPRRKELVVFAEAGRAPVLVSTEIRGYLQKDAGMLVGVFNLPGESAARTFSVAGYESFALDKPGVLFTFAFPQLVSQPRPTESCKLFLNGVTVGRMKLLDDVERTARAVYRQKLPGTLLKAALRTYLKTVAQTKVAKDEDTATRVVGDITAKFLSALDRADTRSWQTLPAEILFYRMEAPDGIGGVSAGCGRPGGRVLQAPPGIASKHIVFIAGLP